MSTDGYCPNGCDLEQYGSHAEDCTEEMSQPDLQRIIRAVLATLRSEVIANRAAAPFAASLIVSIESVIAGSL